MRSIQPDAPDVFKSRAASSHSSTSGTSPDSYAQAARTIPCFVDEERAIAARRRGSRGTRSRSPNARTASPLKSDEQAEVQIERLRPGDVAPRRVARDADRLHAGVLELRSPVTQELHLVRSGGRPVEQVEDEQLRPVLEQLANRQGLVRAEEDRDVGNAFAGLQHGPRLARCAAPAPDELERRASAVRPRELLADVPDRLHVRAVQEHPLVRGRPRESSQRRSATMRSRRTTPGPAKSVSPCRAVDVDEPDLAASAARIDSANRASAAGTPPRELRVEHRNRACTRPSGAEHDDPLARGDREVSAVGRPDEVGRHDRDRRAPDDSSGRPSQDDRAARVVRERVQPSGSQAGGTARASRSSRWSPVPSPATTRSPSCGEVGDARVGARAFPASVADVAARE